MDKQRLGMLRNSDYEEQAENIKEKVMNFLNICLPSTLL